MLVEPDLESYRATARKGQRLRDTRDGNRERWRQVERQGERNRPVHRGKGDGQRALEETERERAQLLLPLSSCLIILTQRQNSRMKA